MKEAFPSCRGPSESWSLVECSRTSHVRIQAFGREASVDSKPLACCLSILPGALRLLPASLDQVLDSRCPPKAEGRINDCQCSMAG